MYDRQPRPLPDAGSGPITIDTAAIPAYVRENLAAATLELIHKILRQPGGREALDARTAARRAAQAAKNTTGRS